MAINLAFIDFVVPISVIKEKYPGGFERFVYDHRKSLGGVDYFDQHLFHTGAMSGEAIQSLKERWTALGFEETEVVDGKEVWKGYCVVESLLQRSPHPCHWLRVDENERVASLAGTDPGPIIGRRLFYEERKSREAKKKFKRDCLRLRWTAILIYRLWHFSSMVGWLTSWMIRQMEYEPTPESRMSGCSGNCQEARGYCGVGDGE